MCGATGFIGRNIAERFAGDLAYEVVAVHHKRPPFQHPGITWVQADLRDPEQVDQLLAGIDVVIQAAATTSGVKDVLSRPHIHIADNAVMNSYLFRSAFDHHVRHVIFFSCTVMLQSSPRALSEQDFDANAEIYPSYFGSAHTKLYLEKMCEFYSRIGSTKFTAIRHSNVYGPHDKFDLERSHVFGATITKVLSATDSVTVWGSGEEARDLVYVDDLAEMVEQVLARQPDRFAIYNCGAGVAVTIKDLVSRIVSASGKALAIRHDLSKPTIPTSVFLDCSKARNELGWEPRVPLKDGIEKTISWWRQNVGS